jgi:multiple sugar transport system substrate-binding protein
MSKSEESNISRRKYLQIAGGTVAGLVVGGALGYVAKPAEMATQTLTQTETQTVTQTATGAAPVTTAASLATEYQGVKLTLGLEAGFTGTPFVRRKDEWKALTGCDYDVVGTPTTGLYEKIMTELVAGTGAFDVIMYCPDWVDIMAGGKLLQLDDYVKNRTVPQLDISPANYNDILPIYRDLGSWQGHVYAIAMDGDCLFMAYRKDILGNPDYQAKFKTQFNYDLPVPPVTWDQYNDVAKFFSGWDWAGDGKVHYGDVEHGKKGRTFWWYLNRAIPYNVLPGGPDKYKGVLYFDPETMDPLINTPGTVRALQKMVDVIPYCPPGVLSYEFVEVMNAFVLGDVVMACCWGDLGRWCNDTSVSKVQGKVGYCVPPGVKEQWDRQNNKWVAAQGNWDEYPGVYFRPSLAWGGWVASVVATTKYPQACYDLIAWVSNPTNGLADVMNPTSGYDPHTYNQFDPKNYPLWKAPEQKDAAGTVIKPQFVDVESYLPAYSKSQEFGFPDLRIPGTFSYYDSIDTHITAALAKEVTAQEALSAVEEDWKKLNDKYGLEQQKKYYRGSIGLPI